MSKRLIMWKSKTVKAATMEEENYTTSFVFLQFYLEEKTAFLVDGIHRFLDLFLIRRGLIRP